VHPMSDSPFPYQPALMSAIRARNLSRIYQGLAVQLRRDGYVEEADNASRDAAWWMNFAISLSQLGPGATDKWEGGAP
jgi:hypothetical protein